MTAAATLMFGVLGVWSLAGCGSEHVGAPDAAPGDGAPGGTDAPTAPALCEGYTLPAQQIAVLEPALIETSGIVSSRAHPGVLWAHNDSGDTARVFALGEDGAALGTLALPVPLVDAEDLALAACPGAPASSPWCLWVADTGNNGRDRDDLALVAVPEPAVSPLAALGQATAAQAWRFPVTYPDGLAIDSEALVIADGRAYLFEKVDGATARVFSGALPTVDGAAIVLAEVATLTSPGIAVSRGRMITGADLHPLGARVVLRVYTGIYEYRLPPGGTVADLPAAERREVTLGPLSEGQGEAVAYDARAGALWTMSEDPEASQPQPLHRYACAP